MIVAENLTDASACPGARRPLDTRYQLFVELDDPERYNPILVCRLVELGVQIQFVCERSLEEVYLKLIAEFLRAEPSC